MKIEIDTASMGVTRKHMQLRAERLHALIPEVIEKGIRIIEAQAKLAAKDLVYGSPPSPSYRRTGRLLSSITEGIEIHPTFASVGPAVHYGKYVELGTKYMAARPFMHTGAEKALDIIKTMVRSEIAKALQ